MTPVKRIAWKRTQYFRGQLLDENDFRAEQDYHRNARLLHNLQFHSWGVVHGLTVSRESDGQVSIAPGLAVDSLGHEVILEEAAVIDVSEFGPNQTVFLTFSSDEKTDDPRKSDYGEGPTRAVEYSVLSASTTSGAGASVTLASVRLDGNSKIVGGSISYSHTKYATSVLAPGSVGYRELADGSITEAKLGAGLRVGWVRMPFKPIPLEDKKAFRIGPTEARSTDEGAGGSMGIPAPPGVTEITRFRIAGELNEGVIKIALFRCGWNEDGKKHERTTLLEKDLPTTASTQGFEETVNVSKELGTMDSQYHALSVVVEATKKTSISLIAVEFGYPVAGG